MASPAEEGRTSEAFAVDDVDREFERLRHSVGEYLLFVQTLVKRVDHSVCANVLQLS